MGVRRFTLQPLITLSVAQILAGSGTAGTVTGTRKYFGSAGVRKAMMVLNCTSHDYTNTDEHYNFFITTGFKTPSGQVVEWDVAEFIDVTGATAAVAQAIFIGEGANAPTSVIANGTLTGVAPALTVIPVATAGITTMAANTLLVREGYWGDWINWAVKTSGTTPGPITFEIAGLVWDYGLPG